MLPILNNGTDTHTHTITSSYKNCLSKYFIIKKVKSPPLLLWANHRVSSSMSSSNDAMARTAGRLSATCSVPWKAVGAGAASAPNSFSRRGRVSLASAAILLDELEIWAGGVASVPNSCSIRLTEFRPSLLPALLSLSLSPSLAGGGGEGKPEEIEMEPRAGGRPMVGA